MMTPSACFGIAVKGKRPQQALNWTIKVANRVCFSASREIENYVNMWRLFPFYPFLPTLHALYVAQFFEIGLEREKKQKINIIFQASFIIRFLDRVKVAFLHFRFIRM